MRTILIKKREASSKWNTVFFKKSLSEAVKNETIIRDTMQEYEGEHRRRTEPQSKPKFKGKPNQSGSKWEHSYSNPVNEHAGEQTQKPQAEQKTQKRGKAPPKKSTFEPKSN